MNSPQDWGADMIRSVVSDWKEDDHLRFEKELFHRKHTFLDRIDVSDAGLAALIDATPDDYIDVVTMGDDPSNKETWRTGDVRGMKGADIIEAVKNGRVWLNLRDLNHLMPDYAKLLDDIYESFEDACPGLQTRRRQLGFIISSPHISTFYHVDVPITILWQLRGVKRVFHYPKKEPYISEELMERIYLNEIDEVEIPFELSWDDRPDCSTVDLQPGEMLLWGHNDPHRVENHDMMNVSLSTEHFTLETMKRYGVYFANGYLRRRFGMGQLGTAVEGLSPWMKSAFTAMLKKSGIQKQHRRVKWVSFRVDPDAPNGVRDIEPYPHGAFNASAEAKNKAA